MQDDPPGGLRGEAGLMRGIVTKLSTSKLMPQFDSENRRKLLSDRAQGNADE